MTEGTLWRSFLKVMYVTTPAAMSAAKPKNPKQTPSAILRLRLLLPPDFELESGVLPLVVVVVVVVDGVIT